MVLLLSLLLFFESVGLSGLEYVSAAEPAMVQMSEDTEVDTDTENGMQSGSSDWINPALSEKEKGQLPKDVIAQTGTDATGLNSYASASSAGKYVRKQLKARNTSFQFHYTGTSLTSAKLSKLMKDILEKACETTSDPQEGDYLYFHLKKVTQSYRYSSSEAIITWNVSYRSTAAQEKTVLAKIKQVVSSLGLTKCSDTEKIKKIHDYICKNTTYDNTESRYTAYNALINGSAVCQGYATLFYAMCLQSGVSVRCIPGYGYGSDGWENHLWNIVKIGSKWYNIDTTWDSQPSYPSGVSYTFFLKNNSSFTGHVRDFGSFRSWTSTQITAFNSKYPMTSASYTGSVGKPVLKSVASTGYNSLKVSWGKVNTAVGYYVYYAVSPSGTYTLAKKVKGGAVTSLNVTGLTPGRTYYFKVRAYSNLLTSAKSGYSAVLSGKAVPAQAVISSLTTKDKSITPVWKKIAGATGYKIAVTYKNGSTSTTKKLYVSAGTKTDQKLTIRGLRAGTNCQVKVQAYTTGSNGSKVYGSYSKVKKITVK